VSTPDLEYTAVGEYTESLRTLQTITEEGNQKHVVGKDTDGVGHVEVGEGVVRRADGSAERYLGMETESGTYFERNAVLGADGQVRSQSEEEYDGEGNLLAGRYDNDGDGVIDRMLKDKNGDGILDETTLSKETVGTNQCFDWQGDGNWTVDADKDGKTDWQSQIAVVDGEVLHAVDLLVEGKVLATETATMHATGTTREYSADVDGNGHSEDHGVVELDATAKALNFTAYTTSNDSTHAVVSYSHDSNGDGKIDEMAEDEDKDGDLDVTKIGS